MRRGRAENQSPNVRASLIDDAERRRWLEALSSASNASARPDASEVLSLAIDVPLIGGMGSDESREAPLVTAVERAAIIAAAKMESSRCKVCQRVFNTAGGRAWDKVKRVCDEERLLLVDGLAMRTV